MNTRETLKINEKNHLEIGGVDCVDLVEQYGTPLYVLDEAYIRGVVSSFKNTIINEYGIGNIAYASKALSCKAMYAIMKSENSHIDVVSGGEIFTALSAGFDISNAYFHGNNKLIDEIKYAMDNKIGTFVIDNLEEIDIINSFAKEYKIKQKVIIRTNPGVEAHTHSFIQTAKIDSKFGFSIGNGDALEAIKKIVDSDNLMFNGLHCHIGSQIFDTQAFALAVDVMTDYIAELKNINIEVNELNLGGGFGVYYTEEDPKFNLNEYCNYIRLIINALNNAIETKKIKKPILTLEPGRSVVGEAGITLYSVGNVKEIKGIKKYVMIDGGMFDNIRPALYDAKYEILLANRANDEKTEVVSIAGKCCESGDILFKDAKLPKALRGDIVAVFTTGAYNYAMASNYNRNLIPPIVSVLNGKSAYAVKPQTYSDLTRNDCIPEYK